ncbi:hypothetical protein GFJ94_07630 [Flavobacterium sp. LMO8]|uniref:hypothetical protein n=1 Tax=Flavobacterium sp. LMO8 TaxID=2654244 RepID=UPI001291C405|nr:hypothetical protein [Flavobacterium sp. LMO8]MQP24931.1 hypothetical protein [Flavobacterium sp. LMO8]
MEKFYIKEKSHEFELSYGSYQIYFTGGWYIKNLEDLDIELINIESEKNVVLKSKDFFGLRRQAYISSQQAVLAFKFENQKYSKLRLTIKNPESLILKRYHPLLFTYNLLHPKNISLEEISVVIK